MPHRPRSAAGRSPVRREIASLAARLMAQDGISDYGLAKRKAARQLGIQEGEGLPTNEEVEVELRAYQSLYQPDETSKRVAEMRRTAVEVMKFLQRFSPYLRGHVLEGTAGRTATIELMLYPGSAKDVELYLLNQGVDYEHQPSRRVGSDGLEMILRFDWGNGVPVTLEVFGENAERQYGRGGRFGDRASLGAVEMLLRGESE